jgi:hypothetical protein
LLSSIWSEAKHGILFSVTKLKSSFSPASILKLIL